MATKVGVDLGSKYIKIAIVEEVSEIFFLKKYASYEVKENITEKEYFTLLKKSIKKFAKNNKLSFMSLNFTLPYDFPYTDIKFIEIPIEDKKILNKSITYEVKQNYENSNSIHYLYDIMSKNEENNRNSIIIGAINKKIINSLSKLKRLTWSIERIELQPISIQKLIKEDAIVIDFGFKSTNIFTYKNGSLFDIHNISIGGKTLEQSIPEDIAKEYKDIHSSFVWNDFLDENDYKEEEILVSKAITEEVNNLSNEVKKHIRNLELENNISFENIYYVGGLSKLLYLPETISKDLKLNIRPINFLTYETKKENYDLNTNLLNDYLIAGAVSIKYKGLEKLNFVKFTNSLINISSLLLIALFMTIVINIGSYNIHNQYNNTISILTDANDEKIAIERELQTTINDYRYKIDYNQKLIGKVEDINNHKNWLSDILFVLPSKTPSTIGFNSILINDNEIIFNGLTEDYLSIGYFAKEIKSLGMVEINSINNEVPGQIILNETDNLDNQMKKEFKITLTYNRPIIDHELQEIGVEPVK